MSEKHLGPEFEIHGGGLDLVFPHHENEIAQSRALGHPFAQVWMHNGMLDVRGRGDAQVASGTTCRCADGARRWGRETLLTFFLTGHWRKPLEYSDATLESAAARAEGFREVFRNASEPARGRLVGAVRRCPRRRLQHRGRPRRHARVARPRPSPPCARRLRARVARRVADEAPDEVVALAVQRLTARASGDFDEADRLRSEIEAAGWDVRDEADSFRLVRRR